MKTHLLSLLAGTGLIAIVGVALAGEPIVITENQMDQVTAGQGVITVNGVPLTLPAGIGIEFVDNALILNVSGVKTAIPAITISGVDITIIDPMNVISSNIKIIRQTD